MRGIMKITSIIHSFLIASLMAVQLSAGCGSKSTEGDAAGDMDVTQDDTIAVDTRDDEEGDPGSDGPGDPPPPDVTEEEPTQEDISEEEPSEDGPSDPVSGDTEQEDMTTEDIGGEDAFNEPDMTACDRLRLAVVEPTAVLLADPAPINTERTFRVVFTHMLDCDEEPAMPLIEINEDDRIVNVTLREWQHTMIPCLGPSRPYNRWISLRRR